MPDLKAAHSQLCNEHRKSGETYAEIRAVALSAFQDLLNVDDRARRSLSDSGLDTMEPRGSLAVDWYSDELSYKEHRVNDAVRSGAWVGVGVAALAGAIGIQLGVWTALGGFGTETADAARWFGVGSISVGRLELALAPLVLSFFCLVAGVSLLVAASLIARRRKSRVERDMGDANSTVKEAMERMEVNGARLRELGNSAKDVADEVSRATGAFQANRNQFTVDRVYEVLNEAGRLYARVQEPQPYSHLYIGRPSPVDSLTSIEATMSSVTIQWEDPDLGSTSIEGYRIRYGGGFLRGEKDLKTVEEAEFTHTGLKRGKTYTYRVIPTNKIGEATVSRTFQARTQEA